MAIDVFTEKVIPLREASQLLPKRPTGRTLGMATLYRWVQRGVRCKDGGRAMLEIVKVGGSTYTSQEALQRFFDRLSANPNDVRPPTITAAQRRRQAEAANEILRREFGI